MKKKNGFTLIELMVVLAIIVIIATAAVPSVEKWTAKNRGLSAVAMIISDFSRAKALAGYSMTVDTSNLDAATNTNFVRAKMSTAIVFRKSSYSIVQSSDRSVFNANTADASPLKKTSLPHNVTLENVNAASPTDTGISPATFIFTSTGRVKKSDDSLVPFGADAGNQYCGNTGLQSPFNGKRIFNAFLKSQINDKEFIWYRIEMDDTGGSFVCMEATDNLTTTLPTFTSKYANVVELYGGKNKNE